MQGEYGETVEGRTTCFPVDLLLRRVAANRMRNFDVDQMRGVKRLTLIEQPLFHPMSIGGAKQYLKQR